MRIVDGIATEIGGKLTVVEVRISYVLNRVIQPKNTVNKTLF